MPRSQLQPSSLPQKGTVMSKSQKKPEQAVMDKLTEMFQKLEMGQKDMKKGQMDITQELVTIKEDMKKEFAGLRNELAEVNQKTEENKKRVEDLEKGVKGLQGGRQNLESMVLNLQMEKSMLFLRFQNIGEEDGEDLKEKMCNILAEYIGKELEHVRWDIDQVYRVNSQYARIHNVPREIHVKFVRMEIRDEILRVQRGGPLRHGGRDINILKQIPKKIRDTRKKYFFLSNKLYLKRIMFRWLVPEGLLIFWEGNRIKINTTSQAEAFLREHGSILEETRMEEGEIEGEQGEGRGGGAESALGAEGGVLDLPRLRPRKEK